MRRLVCSFLLCLALGSFSSARAGFESADIGGGFLWNDGQGDSFQKTSDRLVRASVRYQSSAAFALAHYIEYANGDISKTIGGLHALYNKPLRNLSGIAYLGPGIGALQVDGSTKVLASWLAGIKYPMGEKFDFFFQSEYSYASDSAMEGFTMHGGFSFSLAR